MQWERESSSLFVFRVLNFRVCQTTFTSVFINPKTGTLSKLSGIMIIVKQQKYTEIHVYSSKKKREKWEKKKKKNYKL